MKKDNCIVMVQRKLPEKLPVDFSEALIDKFLRTYADLRIQRGENQLEFIAERMSGEDLDRLVLDFEFLRVCQDIPVENACAQFWNYIPGNESQQQMLDYAKALVALEDVSKARGLFLHGPAGVGKTHIAVAAAKEFMRKGKVPAFRRFDDVRRYSNSLSPSKVQIFDDVNSPYVLGMQILKEGIVNTHAQGGVLLVTSNVPLDYLMEHGFVTDAGNKQRVLDRAKNMFMVIDVQGKSYRERTPWYLGLEVNQG